MSQSVTGDIPVNKGIKTQHFPDVEVLKLQALSLISFVSVKLMPVWASDDSYAGDVLNVA